MIENTSDAGASVNVTESTVRRHKRMVRVYHTKMRLTKSPYLVAKRRAKNKMAKKSRKINRQLAKGRNASRKGGRK